MDIERCPQCQHQLTPADNFCASCGASVGNKPVSDRSAQLVPDLPSQASTDDGDSPNVPDEFQPGTTQMQRFFEHDFVSTALVIVLQVVTLGIWPVHYMKQLTDWLDDTRAEKQDRALPAAISPEFMAANFVFAYTNAFGTLLSLSDADNLSYYVFGSLISIVAFVLHVLWAFKLRTSLQHLWHSTFGQTGVLSGFLTFILGVIYLNFKIVAVKSHYTPCPKA